MHMKKLYIVGDSISIQYGPYLEKALQDVMAYRRKTAEEAALFNPDDDWHDANGGDSGMVMRFLQAWLIAGGIDADILLINCGLHDIKTDPETGQKQVSLAQYEDNLQAIIDLARKMKPELVWIRSTPCDEAIHNQPNMAFHRFSADAITYNAAADSLMRDSGIPIIDLYTFTNNLGPDLYCDHVHFHDHIRQQQAAFIAGWLSYFTANA